MENCVIKRKNWSWEENSDSNGLDDFLDDLEDVYSDDEKPDNSEETVIQMGEPVSGPIVDTSRLRVDFSKIGIKNNIMNLHFEVTKNDTPHIYNDNIEYSISDIELPEREIKNTISEGIDNLVISKTGLTLGEYFDYKRNKYERNQLKHIIQKAKENEILTDENPYEKARNNERKILAGISKQNTKELRVKQDNQPAFISRYKKQTPFEKSILKTLNITQKDLNTLVSPGSILNDDEKATLLSMGANYTAKTKEVKRRKPLSYSDMAVLYFLDKVKLATLNNLHYATNKSELTLGKDMRRLSRLGLVKCIIVYNSPGVWGLTETGAAYINSNRRLPNNKQAGLGAVSERIYVNHVCACLYSGRINILNLDDYPYYGRYNYEGKLVKGEDFVPESDLTSSMWKKISTVKGVFTKSSYKGENTKIIKENWETAWREWELNGRPVEGPELIEGNEYLYILFYQTGLVDTYVVPDIVVKRPRNEDGSSNHIAVEVERAVKTVEEYEKKLTLYKMDNRVYSKVIYVTPSKAIAERVSEAAYNINFDRFDIVPMVNDKGIVKESTSHFML